MRIMKPGFKPVRWLVVVLLGCVLGLLFVFISLSFVTPPAGGNGVPSVAISSRRFQLTEDSRAKELTQVIESQLSAFRHDDYSKAYQYAARILTMQMSLAAFERMVKTGYPVIAHSRSAAFGVIFDNGDQAVVNVGIMGASGQIHHFRYFMDHENKSWKIRGVTEVRFEGTTA